MNHASLTVVFSLVIGNKLCNREPNPQPMLGLALMAVFAKAGKRAVNSWYREQRAASVDPDVPF